MASFRPVSANGTGSGDDKPAVYPSRTPVDTSHYLTSSSHSPYPTTTKTIDIQTDSRELDRHVYISTSASTQVILVFMCTGCNEMNFSLTLLYVDLSNFNAQPRWSRYKLQNG